MAKITKHPRLDLRLTFEVNEAEARALDALAGYGDDAFIEAFYEKLGKSYMRDHEQGLREFLASIREIVGRGLNMIDSAREALKEKAQ